MGLSKACERQKPINAFGCVLGNIWYSVLQNVYKALCMTDGATLYIM